ncbi:Clathrin coat assembly protein AP180 [Liparis tanakae]|uniref:Clathrin coat assembly protein AP180 n=1 Tax=Liparis tanakae TaxID=230148 RepID=A0A4Z2GVW2_9TELE|nr:Clathrin coat assembly protein AP180 [Liparis tanakae]
MRQDAPVNNSSPAPAAAAAAPAPAVAPARRAPPTPGGGPPARPGPPAKPPPPSVTHSAPAPTATPTSSALDDGFLLDLDPMSSSKGGAGTSSVTGWGDLLAEAAPLAPPDEASEALLEEGESDGADEVTPAAAPAAPKAAAPAAIATAPAPASLHVSAADMDLFGGDGPATAAAGPAADAFGGSDPFATTEGSGAIAQELDLFAMMPADTGPPVLSPPTFSEAPTIIAPIAAPTAAPTPSSTTTTTTIDTTTTESAAAPTLDIFGGKVLSLSLCLCTMMMMMMMMMIGWSRADLSPLSALHAALWITADSFGSSVEETQSSAPGGPGDDLLGGLMSPTLAPIAAPALTPVLAPMQNDLLESGFDALGSLTSPALPVPAVVPMVPAAKDPASTTPAPSGGFDASMFGGLGDLLMPSITPQSTGGSTSGSIAGSMGTPVAAAGIASALSASSATSAHSATPTPMKTVGGDLDSSLANLIGDLGVKKKDPQSEKKLTGGANWTPHVAPTSWATAPMAGAASGAPVAAMVPPMSAQPGFGLPLAGGPGAPLMQPMMGQPMMGQPMMRPPFTGLAGAAPGAAAPGAPIPPGPAGQSPKKPKDPLADFNLKDFL